MIILRSVYSMVVIYNFQFNLWTAGKMHLSHALVFLHSLSLSLSLSLKSVYDVIEIHSFEEE